MHQDCVTSSQAALMTFSRHITPCGLRLTDRCTDGHSVINQLSSSRWHTPVTSVHRTVFCIKTMQVAWLKEKSVTLKDSFSHLAVTSLCSLFSPILLLLCSSSSPRYHALILPPALFFCFLSLHWLRDQHHHYWLILFTEQRKHEAAEM